MNILHITAHLGGGVGKAISGLAIQAKKEGLHQHRIVLLQPPEKNEYVQSCLAEEIPVELYDHAPSWLQWADVVVVSWWGHPEMARFLACLPCKSKPLVLWSHTNGVFYPVLSYPLAVAFDQLLVTTQLTLENQNWTPEQREKLLPRAKLVYGMGNFNPQKIVPKTEATPHSFFRVGYVGTLSYGKIHPHFASYCLAVKNRIPSVQFVLVGDPNPTLKQDFIEAGLKDCVEFTGYVSNPLDWMRSFDVFGYLLNPNHYGTTENVLLEAMACGLPVVVRKQNVEQYIVPSDGGVLIDTPEEYASALEQLYQHPRLAQSMGRRGRERVITQYDASKNLRVFHQACQEAINRPIGTRDFTFMGRTAWEWFCSGLCEDDALQLKQILLDIQSSEQEAIGQKRLNTFVSYRSVYTEKRKGSIYHYSDTYPDDPVLSLLAKYLISLKTHESKN